AAVGRQETRALEAEDRRLGRAVEHARRRPLVGAGPGEETLHAGDLRAAGLVAEGSPEPLEVAPEDVGLPEPQAFEEGRVDRQRLAVDREDHPLVVRAGQGGVARPARAGGAQRDQRREREQAEPARVAGTLGASWTAIWSGRSSRGTPSVTPRAMAAAATAHLARRAGALVCSGTARISR